MRSVEQVEGLGVIGPARLGPLDLRTPTLVEVRDPARPGQGLWLDGGPATAGSRRVTLGCGAVRMEIELPVLAHEIAPEGSGIVGVGSGALLLHAPFDLTALRAMRETRPELVILANARVLWNDGEALVEAVRAIRSGLGAEPLLWGPRVALPHRLPMLAYLGFDLFDTTEGELRAAAGEFLDPTLGSRRAPPPTLPRGCDCPACAAAPPGPLAEHARAAYRRASLELAAALARGELRELVEARLPSEAALAELLRYADRSLGELLEARAPVTASASHTYVLAEALRRPEMRRFRDRVVERYRPPPCKTVLLLVPCSRTKPYRRSPSHRRFSAAFEEFRGSGRVHVVSVSSPIGVVPRELEDVPPARHYDIPVTGDWTVEEREVVLRGLRHLLSAGSYRHVVVHLDPVEFGFVHEAIPPERKRSTTVVDHRTTSTASIAKLRETLASCLEDEPGPPLGPREIIVEELREVASVQFGRPAAERLFASPLRLAGRPWFQRLTDGRADLASVREDRGLFHLTIAGALRLGETIARVDVEPSLTLEGDVFAPGVLHADPGVRVGDAVGVFQNGSLAAVGEAALPGPLLGDVRRGLAVRVRHRHHAKADTAKTDEGRPPPGR